MKRLKSFETLDSAAKILNELQQERGQSTFWCADRFLANASNGDINLTVVLPQKFVVERKDTGQKYLDTPLRPTAPKGTDHFFADKRELHALSLGNADSVELNSIVSISNDGARSVLHSAKPLMTISMSDLRISSEQLFRYMEAERPPAQTAAVRVYRKSRTNSVDAQIKQAIKRANSLNASAVFVHLRELALEEAPPFNGQLREKDGALCYTNDKGELAAVTKKGLARRLEKHSL
jgi:hypothetical protein